MRWFIGTVRKQGSGIGDQGSGSACGWEAGERSEEEILNVCINNGRRDVKYGAGLRI
jgi:hypothetical protein